MIQEQTIRKLTDYLLQRAGSVNSSGLYDGNAGLSLSLFEAARYLQDENIENKVFNLLQKALLTKNKDYHFENGLSGIGYVLLYLIENKFVDADFNEIYGKQYEKIIGNFDHIEKEPQRLVNSLQSIYFFSKVSNIKQEDERLKSIMKRIIEGLEFFLAIQLNDFTDIHYINNKVDILKIYELYLKLIDYSGYVHFSKLLLKDYANLYRTGRIMSSLTIGHYLDVIVKQHNIKEYEDVVEYNIKNGIENIHPETLSLKEKIDLTILIYKNKVITPCGLLPDMKNIHEEVVIENVRVTKNNTSSPFGYGAGLGRLLLFYVNKHAEFV